MADFLGEKVLGLVTSTYLMFGVLFSYPHFMFNFFCINERERMLLAVKF